LIKLWKLNDVLSSLVKIGLFVSYLGVKHRNTTLLQASVCPYNNEGEVKMFFVSCLVLRLKCVVE